MKKLILLTMVCAACLLLAYPALAVDVTYDLAASVDDTSTYYLGGAAQTNDPTGANVTFGRDVAGSNLQLWSYYRFALDIPKGSTIVSARLHFLANISWTAVFNTSIRGLAKDNMWEVDGFTVAHYADTDALLAVGTIGSPVTWSNVAGWTSGNWYYSVDIASILRDQINATDYDPSHAEDQYVAYEIDDGDGAFNGNNYRRRANSYDAAPATAAELVVTYNLPEDGVLIRR